MYRTPSAPGDRERDLDWNTFAPGYQIDPYRHYRWLRDNAPVHRVDLPGGFTSYLVSRHEDCYAVLMDAATFSSAATKALTWLVFQDPPDHTRLRRTIARAFTPKAIDALDPDVERLTREFFAPLLHAGGGDAMRFCSLLPVGVIALILGIPTSESAKLAAWSQDSLECLGDFFGRPPSDKARRGSDSLIAYLREVLQAYRVAPNQSIGSALMQASMRGDLTEAEVLSFAQFLFVAGHETTMHTLAGGVGILAQDASLFARLRGNPGLIGGFVEEVLRYRPALQSTARIATRDVTLGGVDIPKGSHVRVLLGNANLDPAVFPDGERFDALRAEPGHLTFGKGIHACIGAPLARREMLFAFRHLLATVGEIALDPAEDPIPHVGGSTNEYGFDRLPVRLVPA